VPAILVYGTPSGPAMTQASWFRAEDKEAVKAAAEALKFSVIELQTDADKALTAGAHEGVLKGSGGRMIVGSVSPEVYRRIAKIKRSCDQTERLGDPFDFIKIASGQDWARSPVARRLCDESPGVAGCPIDQDRSVHEAHLDDRLITMRCHTPPRLSSDRQLP
jgi:hypothetical protein